MITTVKPKSMNEAMDPSAFKDLVNKKYAGLISFKDGTAIGYVPSGGGRYSIFKNDNDDKGRFVTVDEAIKHYEDRKNSIRPPEKPDQYAHFYGDPFIDFLKMCNPGDQITIGFDHNTSLAGFSGRINQVTWYYVNHPITKITKDPKYGYKVTLGKPGRYGR